MTYLRSAIWFGLGIYLAYMAFDLMMAPQLDADGQAARSAGDRVFPLILFGLGAVLAIGYAVYLLRAPAPYATGAAPAPAGSQSPATTSSNTSGARRPLGEDFRPDPMPEGFQADFDEKLVRLAGFGIDVRDRVDDDRVVKPGTTAAEDLAAEVWRSMQWFHKVFNNRISDRAPPGDILLLVNGDSKRFATDDVLTLPGDGGYAVGVYANIARDLFAYARLSDVATAEEHAMEDDRRRLTWTINGGAGEYSVDAAGKYIDMGAPAAIARAIRDAGVSGERLAVIQEDVNIRVIRLSENRLTALKDFFDDQDVYWLDAT
ncbi:MAG: hypothetical protein AAFZ05_05535 [Pseudomonadota bacterium]